MNFLNSIDISWTLFLDRDGVINVELDNDYIRSVDAFVFYPNIKEAIAKLSSVFGKIIIVTNQRGVGRGLMTESALHQIHTHMLYEIKSGGGDIHAIYFAPDVDKNALNRKPNIGMALQAKSDFPTIDFNKSVMVGNNISDMEFGKSAGMKTVFVKTTNKNQQQDGCIDIMCNSLFEFSQMF